MSPRQRFKTWRLNRGMTQGEIALEFGVSLALVSNWERGLARLPDRVRTAMRRHTTRSDSLTDFGQVFARLMSGAERNHRKSLPLRQRIAALVAEGRRQKDIAAELCCTTMTVYRHALALREAA